MQEIVFVTHNKGKIASAQNSLRDVNFKIYEYELDEPRSEDIRKISEAKVREAYEIVKKPCIALDSGFFIDELGGFPKSFVNFSLETIGVNGILKLMEGKENRNCAFKECLSYFDGKELYQFEGLHKGTISKEILGNDTNKKWSDLWYIFIPENYTKTLAEMTDSERAKRNEEREKKLANSMSAFAKWYKENRI